MTPKEKAIDIFSKIHLVTYNGEYHMKIEQSISCALICVDEICEAINWHEFESPNEQWEYWNKVKQEIEKLE